MNMKAQKSRATASAGDCQWQPATAVARKNSLKLAALLCQRSDWTKLSIEEAIFDDVDGSQFGDAKIPNPSHFARIVATNTSSDDTRPQAELLHYFGDGLLCFPFTATFDAEIRYPITKADFARLPKARKRRATLIPKETSGYTAAEACKLQLKALAMIELDAEGQKVLGTSRASQKDLLDTIATAEFRVSSIRVLRILSFVDRLPTHRVSGMVV